MISCPHCHRPIQPGRDTIRAFPGGWAHANCATPAPAGEPRLLPRRDAA